jgi:hypothetical protein
MLRLGLVGCTVTPPSVFGSDCVGGGAAVDAGGGPEAAAALQFAGGTMLCGAVADARLDASAFGVDNPVPGVPVSDGVDGVGGGAMVEP